MTPFMVIFEFLHPRIFLAEAHEGKKTEKSLCTICGRDFQKTYLKVHITEVHEGRKTYPHTCDICGHGSARLQDLKAHKASVHYNIKPHQCRFVFNTFSKRDESKVL